MDNDNWLGIAILIGIIAIALFGGSKGESHNALISTPNQTPEQKQQNIQNQINSAQIQVKTLERQIKVAENSKTQSIYYGKINLSYVNHSADPNQEYIAIQVPSYGTTTIPVTGWKLVSTNTGNTVVIPQGTYLFFQGSQNTEQDIYLVPSDTMYVITGVSPLGVSFKSNKCSGYLTQFQKFYPYINKVCPKPKDEGSTTVIPQTLPNDSCMDYLNIYPRCTVPIANLPNTLTYECKNFIETRLNYPYCINAHKGDIDFDQHEWRVYLKRGAILWKSQRENIVLYDNQNKIVATLTY